MRRRGFTLVEMIAVITACTVLLGIAICLLVVLQRSEGDGREHFERGNSLALLAERFRRDVHAAVEPPQAAEYFGRSWRFPSPLDPAASYVEYAVDGAYLTRLERVEGKPDRWETYALPKDCTARVKIEAVPGGRLARLLIAPRGADSTGGREIRVEAVLGRDHRFASRTEGSK